MKPFAQINNYAKTIIGYLTNEAVKKPDSNSQNLASEEGDEKPRKMAVFSPLKPLYAFPE